MKAARWHVLGRFHVVRENDTAMETVLCLKMIPQIRRCGSRFQIDGIATVRYRSLTGKIFFQERDSTGAAFVSVDAPDHRWRLAA
jgi:hypothetical protein